MLCWPLLLWHGPVWDALELKSVGPIRSLHPVEFCTLRFVITVRGQWSAYAPLQMFALVSRGRRPIVKFEMGHDISRRLLRLAVFVIPPWMRLFDGSHISRSHPSIDVDFTFSLFLYRLLENGRIWSLQPLLLRWRIVLCHYDLFLFWVRHSFTASLCINKCINLSHLSLSPFFVEFIQIMPLQNDYGRMIKRKLSRKFILFESYVEGTVIRWKYTFLVIESYEMKEILIYWKMIESHVASIEYDLVSFKWLFYLSNTGRSIWDFSN